MHRHFLRLSSVVTTLLCTLSQSTPLPKPRQSGFVHLPTVRRSVPAVRRWALDVPLDNMVYTYAIEIGVGSPPQPVTLMIDTGSSDTWTYGPSSCDKCKGGIYNPEESYSGTYADDLGQFSTVFFDQTYVDGYYVRDNVQIADTNVEYAVIGVATDSPDKTYGFLGLGLDGLEASSVGYPGFIDNLKTQGVIETAAYSIYLESLESASGSLLLGGIDRSKYTGDLVELPITSSTDGYPRLNIQWNSISITGSKSDTTFYSPRYLPYPVVLDTGYSFTVLGNDIFYKFVKYFHAVLNKNGIWKVDCHLGTGWVDFGFGVDDEVIISVPFSEFAVPNVFDNTGGCAFGFEPAGKNPVLSFGDTFLRSAYVVYNLDAMTISLAQASYDQSCTDCAEAI